MELLPRIDNPPKEQWPDICRRPNPDSADIERSVSTILSAVQKSGDQAVRRYAQEFDGVH
ncbi:MAG: histidinol dehydrogenase, partial [Saprospiraceae bacterium]|nr:histidinol dehydrogenase [Saprospiraceae bacterium]